MDTITVRDVFSAANPKSMWAERRRGRAREVVRQYATEGVFALGRKIRVS